MKKILIITLAFVGALTLKAQNVDDLFEMDLGELMQMEITSVSKKAERLQDVSSAIYVVTNDDIVKSGATNLHEVLRNVPGYWGAQNEYNDVVPLMRISPTTNGSAGTMLYLLDGTPIQDLMNSTFSFRNFDIPLNDIDRIEIIRGSGGTIYGANSATGVVNIFTKNPDKYNGVQVSADVASPTFIATSVTAGGKINDKLSASVYGKARIFNGFESLAGNDEDGNEIVAESRFTEDYEKSNMYSFGGKVDYNLSEKSKISFRGHYNMLDKIQYSNYVNSDFVFTEQDVLAVNDVNSNRLVANLRFDHEFNESHSVFVRASTNRENDFIGTGGGYYVDNSIIDFEVQDNISLGQMNDLSVGVNYRAVNFDVHDINATGMMNYINPQASESLKGAFIQNKFKLFNGKLNFLAGLKGENYSLVNDDYYISPMAKLSFIPSDNLTLWGGYTQSYTTPGFINTNIDLYLFQAPTASEWDAVVRPQVEAGVYQGAFDQVIGMGADSTTAAAGAAAYLASQAGQDIVDAQTAGAVAGQQASTPSIAVKNGSTTVPTKFQTWEAGFRTNIDNQLSLESNFFYSTITDGIGVSPGGITGDSPTDPGRTAEYYLYGNYVQGTNYGTESMIKSRPMKGVNFEISHTWNESNWEYQENDDFDVNDINIIADKDQTTDVPRLPKHIFRVKGGFDLPQNFNLSLGLIYASKFSTQVNYVHGEERYVNGGYEPASDADKTIVALDKSRTILNMRIEKAMMDDKLSVYVFGNDMLNKGNIVQTRNYYNTTLSKIGAMFGAGINYKIK